MGLLIDLADELKGAVIGIYTLILAFATYSTIHANHFPNFVNYLLILFAAILIWTFKKMIDRSILLSLLAIFLVVAWAIYYFRSMLQIFIR